MSTLVEMFRHHLWANLRLIAACEKAGESALAANAEGTYGEAGAALLHMLAAEERYLVLLTGEPQSTPPLSEREPFPGLARLRERAERSGEALIRLVEADPGENLLEGENRYGPYSIRTFVPLIQAIHHGNEHRTHVTTALSQNGIEPPDLSAWAFGEEMGYAM
jgi:uncharacterized damage-inducible protein DinB